MKAVLALRELTGEFEKPQVLPLPAAAVRPQPQRADRLHRLHRRLLDARHPQRRVAARARRRQAAPWPAQGAGATGGGVHRRAAPVRGLRRLQHGLPERRDELRLPGPGRPGPAPAHPAHGLRPCRRARRRAAAAQPGRRRAAGRRTRAAPRAPTAQLHGVPARVLPVALWHTASVGLDLWLAAIAQGASQVWVLLTDEEAPEYRQALAEQMAVAQAMLTGLGYAGEHLRLLEARDARDLAALDAGAARAAGATAWRARPPSPRRPTSGRTLELALDHLLAQAPAAARGDRAAGRRRALRQPGGRHRQVHAVPELRRRLPCGALADNPEQPQLRFIEKNCVQCGLCASTCPEGAITLQPRLWLADGGKARKSRARAARDGALRLRALRQALRHAACHRGDGRQAGRPCGLPGRGGRTAEDVRRLPRHRHPQPPRTKSASPTSDAPPPMTATAPPSFRQRRRQRGTGPRRALRPAGPPVAGAARRRRCCSSSRSP